MFLEKKDFENIVLNTPLVSIDLCILDKRKILLGKRKNHPAKNFYFVPGGRIRKNEIINIALSRILEDEIGYKFIDDNIQKKLLGIYEHFYDDNFLGNNKFKTHYIVLAFLISFDQIEKISDVPLHKDQHSNYIWYDLENKIIKDIGIHKYTYSYIEKLMDINL